MNVVKHRIKLLKIEKSPILSGLFQTSPNFREFEKAENGNMLAKNIFKLKQIEWIVLTVFLPEKDESLQFCVDTRMLNAITDRESYPVPRKNE